MVPLYSPQRVGRVGENRLEDNYALGGVAAQRIWRDGGMEGEGTGRQADGSADRGDFFAFFFFGSGTRNKSTVATFRTVCWQLTSPSSEAQEISE